MPLSRQLWSFAVLLCGVCAWGAPVRIFVSPEGNDQWSGTQPKVGLVGNGGPFRTLARAQAAIREWQGKAEGIEIVLGAGEYSLPAGLVLGPDELGTVPVAFTAAPAAAVVLRGDLPLVNRRRHPDGSHIATRPPGEAVAMFYGDEALPLARYPNRDAAHPYSGGFCYVTRTEKAAGNLFLSASGLDGLAPESWAHLTEATVLLWPDDGTRQAVRLTSANRSTGGLCLPELPGTQSGTRLVFTGLLSELNAPGEWLPVGETLRFLPPEDCDPDRDLTVATADPLLAVRGGKGLVSFTDIEFRGAAGNLVQIEGAACVFTRCAFRAAVGDGIRCQQGKDVRIEGCDFRNLGGAAIRFADTQGAVVRNCWIAETGDQLPTPAAILTEDDGCTGLVILRNLIHDQPGSGILLRGEGHRCERNWLHHLGQERSEGGGIVIQGHPGGKPSVVKGNVVIDPGGYRRIDSTHYAFPAGTAGIVALWGTGTLVAENLLVRCPLAGVLVAGQNQAVENNLIVGEGESQIGIGAAIGVTVRHNVAASRKGNPAWLAGDRLPERLRLVDSNLVWSETGDPCVRLGKQTLSWDAWQELGFDRHSMVADPLFRAPELDEYTLLRDSLALRLGFVPLEPEQVGCQEEPPRRTWPIDDEVWREQHLLGVAGPRSVTQPAKP